LQLLYFDEASGRLLKGSCRDTAWASFSSTLGFPCDGHLAATPVFILPLLSFATAVLQG
jgi:hypothetical protein